MKSRRSRKTTAGRRRDRDCRDTQRRGPIWAVSSLKCNVLEFGLTERYEDFGGIEQVLFTEFIIQ